LTETQATVASLRDQCEALTSHLADADADITTLLDDRAELMAYDAELAAMVAAKATALVTAEAERCTLQEQLTAVMESHDQVTAEREQALSDKEGLEAIVLQHREAMATNACTLGDTETALAEANAQVRRMQLTGCVDICHHAFSFFRFFVVVWFATLLRFFFVFYFFHFVLFFSFLCEVIRH
jgi:hypothetical protein